MRSQLVHLEPERRASRRPRRAIAELARVAIDRIDVGGRRQLGAVAVQDAPAPRRQLHFSGYCSSAMRPSCRRRVPAARTPARRPRPTAPDQHDADTAMRTRVQRPWSSASPGLGAAPFPGAPARAPRRARSCRVTPGPGAPRRSWRGRPHRQLVARHADDTRRLLQHADLDGQRRRCSCSCGVGRASPRPSATRSGCVPAHADVRQRPRRHTPAGTPPRPAAPLADVRCLAPRRHAYAISAPPRAGAPTASADCAPVRHSPGRRRAWSAGASAPGGASPAAPRAASALSRCLTMRSSSEWNAITTSRPPGRRQSGAHSRKRSSSPELVVDGDAQRLERPRRGVLVRLAAGPARAPPGRELARGVCGSALARLTMARAMGAASRSSPYSRRMRPSSSSSTRRAVRPPSRPRSDPCACPAGRRAERKPRSGAVELRRRHAQVDQAAVDRQRALSSSTRAPARSARAPA